MAPAPQSLSKIAAPVGACAALAVAVGVWLIPGSVLDPKPPEAPQGVVPARPAPEPIVPPAPVEHDWTALVQNLDRLRAHDATQVVETPGQETQPPVPPPPTGDFTLPWVYEGYIVEENRTIALVRIANVQRFLFPGQEIKDPSSIPGDGAAIKSIEPERLIVTVGEREIEVKRAPKAQSGAPTAQQAGRIE